MIGLLIVIGMQFAYMVYTDKQNRIERERTQLKVMSKDIAEYKDAISPPDKDTPEERDAYSPVEDVDLELLSEAIDNT